MNSALTALAADLRHHDARRDDAAGTPGPGEREAGAGGSRCRRQSSNPLLAALGGHCHARDRGISNTVAGRAPRGRGRIRLENGGYTAGCDADSTTRTGRHADAFCHAVTFVSLSRRMVRPRSRGGLCDRVNQAAEGPRGLLFQLTSTGERRSHARSSDLSDSRGLWLCRGGTRRAPENDPRTCPEQ
jgi:hypothetical protein